MAFICWLMAIDHSVVNARVVCAVPLCPPTPRQFFHTTLLLRTFPKHWWLWVFACFGWLFAIFYGIDRLANGIDRLSMASFGEWIAFFCRQLHLSVNWWHQSANWLHSSEIDSIYKWTNGMYLLGNALIGQLMARLLCLYVARLLLSILDF